MNEKNHRIGYSKIPNQSIKKCKKLFKHFGKNAEFRIGAFACHCYNISIGNNVVIRENSMLFANQFAQIIVEDNVLLGANVSMFVNNHKFDDTTKPIIEQGYSNSKSIVLKKGCWVGANVVILRGVTIGENSVVGAGSIVTKSVSPQILVAGNPAKFIRTIQEHGLYCPCNECLQSIKKNC